MPTTVIEIVFAVVVAAIAGVTGWCLRGSRSHRKPRKDGNEIRYAREVLSRLHELAAHVAADVGEHTSRVEEINEELLSTAADETEAVVSAVDKLLEANSQMQGQLASAEDRLQQQARQIESHAAEARTDALTQLANRRAFDDEMAHRFAEFHRRGKIFSVMMVDVDHFKRFNDEHGHQAGDAVLRGLAGALRSNVREMDLVTRYGGEEFAVVLPGAPVADACSAAERVRQAIATTPFPYRAMGLHVTVSIGVAELLPDEGLSVLIQRADEALYASKAGGRNCVCWHDGQQVHPAGQTEPSPSQAAEQPAPGIESSQEEPAGAEAEPPPIQPAASAPGAGSVTPGEVPGDRHPRLCDRAALQAWLRGALKRWRAGGVPPGILLVRIDDYPTITSRHGTQAAESVLCATRRVVEASLPDTELLARYDTATVAAVLPAAKLADTIEKAEYLRTTAEQCQLPLANEQLRFTVSVSAAVAHDEDASGLLQRAEQALQAASQSGGNCSYFHNGEWSEIVRARLQMTR